MVQCGWIGSKGQSTALIQELIEQSLSEDHSVIIAVSERKDEGNHIFHEEES